MISRSLGVESGGAIGLPLYMALALSAALYTTGFAESFVAVLLGLSPRVVAVGVAALALRSVTLVIRVQYLIILAAPRVLQALARDGVLTERGRWLGRGSGPGQELRFGAVLTLVIVLAAVLLGDLNAIAPVLTMFVLTTYLVLNLAAGIEGIVERPSFRPAFRVHWVFSILGAAACLGVMFMINPAASIVAAAVVLAAYLWLEQCGLRATWGDVRDGVWLMFLRTALLKMGSRSAEEWRT